MSQPVAPDSAVAAWDADRELALAAASGRAEAFEEIVRRHAGMVLGLGMRLLGNRADAEDLVQDVFVRAHRGLGSFRGACSLKTWVCQVAVNAARNRARGEARRTRHLAAVPAPSGGDPVVDDPLERAEDGAAGPERLLLAAETRERIEAALAGLAPEFREALVLREIEGLSYEEIAAATGTEIGTVKSRIARARARLQDALRDLVVASRAGGRAP